MEFPTNKRLKLPPDNISEWYKVQWNITLLFPMPGNSFVRWLVDETSGRFYHTHNHIYFEQEADAIMYALRWA